MSYLCDVCCTGYLFIIISCVYPLALWKTKNKKIWHINHSSIPTLPQLLHLDCSKFVVLKEKFGNRSKYNLFQIWVK